MFNIFIDKSQEMLNFNNMLKASIYKDFKVNIYLQMRIALLL